MYCMTAASSHSLSSFRISMIFLFAMVFSFLLLRSSCRHLYPPPPPPGKSRNIRRLEDADEDVAQGMEQDGAEEPAPLPLPSEDETGEKHIEAQGVQIKKHMAQGEQTVGNKKAHSPAGP